ncbi:hypothetical protein TIFTF001_022924 [Ficus carica]|uniref:Uncharacterized protein n=1 Tax=Ficus carica TaxID=3494 RepID=A0AA88AIQ0_FICCA|nr:hypothetical protein TIFTF001_022924 [Ficus carica]
MWGKLSAGIGYWPLGYNPIVFLPCLGGVQYISGTWLESSCRLSNVLVDDGVMCVSDFEFHGNLPVVTCSVTFPCQIGPEQLDYRLGTRSLE